MIIFVDPKPTVGGGQVVLKHLLKLVEARCPTALSVPDVTYSAVAPNGSTPRVGAQEMWQLIKSQPCVVVANANSAFPRLALTGFRARMEKRQTTTVAIVHNHPKNWFARGVTSLSLRMIDHAFVVEPTLTALRANAVVPPWLSIPFGHPISTADTGSRELPKVKAFARPDRSKGLELLTSVYPQLEALGFQCEVALGHSIDGDRRYEEKLRSRLRPWLVDGYRTPDWVEAGEIFLVTSRWGEAACLAAQEVLARGGRVVASRVGLMPFLDPTSRCVRTYAPGDVADAVGQVRALGLEPQDQMRRSVDAARRLSTERRGLWYRYVGDAIVALVGGCAGPEAGEHEVTATLS